MYRLLAVSVIFLAVACKGGTKSASAANTASSTSDSALPASNQPSNTAGDLAGPTSTTENGAGGSASGAALPGKPNPNRTPNEMGRIMVLEYHLITDHNGDYARERGQYRKDLELLYNRGYRPVNMVDVLDKKLNLFNVKLII